MTGVFPTMLLPRARLLNHPLENIVADESPLPLSLVLESSVKDPVLPPNTYVR